MYEKQDTDQWEFHIKPSTKAIIPAMTIAAPHTPPTASPNHVGGLDRECAIRTAGRIFAVLVLLSI